LSEARQALNGNFSHIINEVDRLRAEVKELNERVELLTPANVVAAHKVDETVQVPLRTSRTVDWRTKKAELEKKYAKANVREELVKEISSPADIFQDK